MNIRALHNYCEGHCYFFLEEHQLMYFCVAMLSHRGWTGCLAGHSEGLSCTDTSRKIESKDNLCLQGRIFQSLLQYLKIPTLSPSFSFPHYFQFFLLSLQVPETPLKFPLDI